MIISQLGLEACCFIICDVIAAKLRSFHIELPIKIRSKSLMFYKSCRCGEQVQLVVNKKRMGGKNRIRSMRAFKERN